VIWNPNRGVFNPQFLVFAGSACMWLTGMPSQGTFRHLTRPQVGSQRPQLRWHCLGHAFTGTLGLFLGSLASLKGRSNETAVI
jgi:hypothetical protein